MKLIWGKDKIFAIEQTPQWKIDKAFQMITEAIEGKIPFCFSLVPKILLYEGTEPRNKLIKKREELQKEPSNAIARNIRCEIKAYKNQIKECILFDTITYKKLKSNYNKLHNALKLLSKDNLIASYTLRSNGILKVNWLDSDTSRFKVTIIEQGLTWDIDQVVAVKTTAQIEREYQNDKLFCGIKSTEEIIPQGKLNKKYEGSNKLGPGGVDPVVFKYKNNQNVQIPELDKINDWFKDLTKEKLIQVLAILIYFIRKFNNGRNNNKKSTLSNND